MVRPGLFRPCAPGGAETKGFPHTGPRGCIAEHHAGARRQSRPSAVVTVSGRAHRLPGAVSPDPIAHESSTAHLGNIRYYAMHGTE